MSPAPRRADDPETVDYSKERDGFALTLPFQLGVVAGQGRLGIVALLIIGVFGTFGSIGYVNYHGLRENRALINEVLNELGRQHDSAHERDLRALCLAGLTERERVELRNDRKWTRWCYWLDED